MSKEPIFDDPDEPVDELDNAPLYDQIVESEIVDAELVEEFDDLGVESESSEGEPSGEGTPQSDEQRPGGRRRRRRRRGRRGKLDRSEESADRREDVAEAVELSAEGADVVEADLESADSALGDSEAGETAEPEAGEDRKGRRPRRRRRRGGRDRKPSAETESGEPAATPHRELDDDDAESDELDDPRAVPSGGDMGVDHDDEDSELDRHSHRGIPSWAEATGYIIDANMESRARSPKSGGPRGRRGRGRPSGGRREGTSERPSS